MKILFFHRWVGVHGGGTETHLKELANRFAFSRHEVSILTRAGQPIPNLSNEIKVFRVSRNRGEFDHSYEDARVYWHTGLFMIKSFFTLLKLYLKGYRPDVISVHFYTEAVVARVFRFFTRIPYIFILEGYTELEAKEAKRANGAVAISEYEARRCYADFAYRPEVIPVGVDIERFSPKGIGSKLMPEGKFKILTVCRLEPRKDLFTLIDAAERFRDNHLIHFYLAGTGIQANEIASAVKAKKLSNFTLLGFVPDNELPKIYRTADIFILPTFEEGFGIVLAEAMAAGVPVISNPSGSVPEVVGTAGLLVKNKDPKALAQAIIKLTNPATHSKFVKAGLGQARTYDWNKVILEYENAYQRTAKKA